MSKPMIRKPAAAEPVVGSKVWASGEQGRCESWDAKKCKWMVKMLDDEVLALCREKLNLIPVAGDKVRLHGLKTNPELNEMQGTFEEWDKDSNRCMVRLHNGQLKSIGPDHVEVLVVRGSKVRLHGLQATLNDAQGTCEEWIQGKGRWNVRLQNGDVKAVKPANIQVQAGGGGGGGDNGGSDDDASAEPGPPAQKRPRLAKASLEQLRQVFARCDTSKDGTISRSEVIKACRADRNIAALFDLPTTIRQEDGSRTLVMDFFRDMDIDDSDSIDMAEFIAYFRRRGRVSDL